jgi:membrane protein DedA with SNARE-associated domain
MVFSSSDLYNILTQYQYSILLPVSFLEGPIITVIAGYLTSLHIMNGYVAFAIVVIGDVLSDIFWYEIGYLGKPRALKRWGPTFGFTPERVKVLEEKYKNRQGQLIIIGKLAQGINGIFFVTAALLGISFSKFVLWSTASTLVKSAGLFAVGYYLGEAYQQIGGFLNLSSIVIPILFVIIIAFFLARRVKLE